jgi:ubiquinol oxidase
MYDFEHEKLNESLCNPSTRAEYAAPCNGYRPSIIVRALGGFLINSGNLFYGFRPSYGKFRALEVIARIPYQSWEVASYTFLTAAYMNEAKAIELAKTSAFSRTAQDNETMHVVVISQLARKHNEVSFISQNLLPLLFSLFYFWAIFFLYLVSPRSALELNYLFEDHAYHQYEEFLKREGEGLRRRTVTSEYLNFYGRHVRSEYEFFESVRNDELVHRNTSLRRAQELASLRARAAEPARA